MAKWYEEWFDRDEYEFVYRHRDEADATALLDTIEKTLNPSPGQSILDVGCGRGRHSIALADRGYQMTGIDLSRQSIADARARAAEAGVDVSFEVMDMRTPFCNACFDGVVNLFTAFGYFDEQREHQRAIHAMASALKPGGWLVQDFLNAPFVRDTLVSHSVERRDGLLIEQSRWIENARINKRIILKKSARETTEDGEGQASFTESVALLDRDDFEEMYAIAGLDIITILGTYHGDAYNHSSPRMILFSRKRQVEE